MKEVYGYLEVRDLLATLFDKSFGFCMIWKPKYRGKLGKMPSCSQFQDIKVRKNEIVTKKESQINNILQQ